MNVMIKLTIVFRDGKRESWYGCEGPTRTDICIANKLNNECRTENGITLCCCDGDL